MNNSIFENSTKFYFGKGCEKEYLADILSGYGNTTMEAYGGVSIAKSAIFIGHK